MKIAIVRALSVLAAAATLGGCYAQLESQSMTLTRAVPVCDDGAGPCVFSGFPVPPVALDVLKVGTQANFTIDLDQDILEPEKEVGPITLKTTLLLNRAVLTMGDQYDSNLGGVEEIQLVQLPDASASLGVGCLKPVGSVVIATYVRSATTGAATKSVTLSGQGVNLIALVGNTKKLVLSICARGALPAIDWTGTIAMDVALKARGEF